MEGWGEEGKSSESESRGKSVFKVPLLPAHQKKALPLLHHLRDVKSPRNAGLSISPGGDLGPLLQLCFKAEMLWLSPNLFGNFPPPPPGLGAARSSRCHYLVGPEKSPLGLPEADPAPLRAGAFWTRPPSMSLGPGMGPSVPGIAQHSPNSHLLPA